MKAVYGLVVMVLLTGCMTEKKAYNKVWADTFRDANQRNIIAKICLAEYPAITDTPKVIFSGIDSSAYEELVNYSNSLIDSMIARGQDTADIKPGYILKCTPYDSARIIKKFMMNYKPPAVVKTIVKEIRVRDAAFIALKNSEVAACQYENETISRKLTEAQAKLGKKSNTNWWLIVLAALLGIGNALQIWLRIKS